MAVQTTLWQLYGISVWVRLWDNVEFQDKKEAGMEIHGTPYCFVCFWVSYRLRD